MKKLIFILFLITITVNAQSVDYSFALNDTVIVNNQAQATTYVSKVNLTGNYTMMVIVIGFPDIPSTQSWPNISTNINYPHRGAFPNGTTLKDSIASNGPINVEDWYGAGIEHFFDTQSNGEFTVSVTWPKTTTNTRYLTDSTLAYWENILNRNYNIIMFNKWNEMGNQVARKMVADDPNIFDDVDFVQLSFDGVAGSTFNTEHGGQFLYIKKLYEPGNSSNVYFEGPMAINKRTESLLTQRQ